MLPKSNSSLAVDHVTDLTCPDRSTELVANGTTDLNGVKLLHFTPDPAQGAVDPTYFQYFEGLLNITSPTAAGELVVKALANC